MNRHERRAARHIHEPQGVRVPVKARIMVATPTYSGSVAHECAASMMVATTLCLLKGVVLEWFFAAGFSLVQYGRNWLNAEFLSRPEFTHLLWLDDDLGFEADAILKLLDADKDAVGGVYLTKHPVQPVFPYEAIGEAVDALQPVQKLPGGFLLLKRHVVETISASCDTFMLEHDGVTRESPHVFDLAYASDPDHPGKMRLLGEDYVMNQRLLDAGFELYARTDIGFSHIGRRAWNGKLQLALDDKARVEAAESHERSEQTA